MIVCVEGNIGSGKSTLLHRLQQEHNVVVKEEPIGDWGKLIDLYYDTPTQWALPFNLKVLHSFCDLPDNKDRVVFVERSPGACRHVFGQLGYNDEHLSPAAWDVFKQYHDLLSWEPAVYIYIDTSPEQCLERIQYRGRACERGLTEEYLRRIEFQYTNFLKFTETPTHTVDGNRCIEDVLDDVLTYCKTLKDL